MTEQQKQRLEYAKQSKPAWPKNQIGANVLIHKTAIIGEDGFGYARDFDGSYVKMHHRGNVVIGEGTEIRAYVTIDRAVEGSTVIGIDNKIDHHVHIAHNAKIGDYNSFANGCSIEGSVEIGSFNTFGSNVTFQRKVKVGSYCRIGSGAVITKDIPDREVWVGCPAEPINLISLYPKLELNKEYDIELANYFCGLSDGESWFTEKSAGKRNSKSFRFGIEMSSRDKSILLKIKDFFGVGNLTERTRETLVNKLRAHQYCYSVSSRNDLLGTIIPFFDNFKLRGYKKIQYLRWREKFFNYYINHARNKNVKIIPDTLFNQPR